MEPYPFYTWIHRADLFLSDIMVGFDNSSQATSFANMLIDNLPNRFFSNSDSILVGGNNSIQILVIPESYEPEEGWEAWAYDYLYMSMGEVLNLKTLSDE